MGLLPQANYTAPTKLNQQQGQRRKPSGGGRSTEDVDEKRSMRDKGRGGGGRRRECWICHDPDHLSYECLDRNDSEEDDTKGGRGRSTSRRPRRDAKPSKEKQTSTKDIDNSSGKSRGDGEASCSMVGVVEPTVSLAPEAGKDFQAVVATVQANPMAVLLNSGCSHHLMGTKAVIVDMAPSDGVKHVRGFNGALQPVEGRKTIALQGEARRRVLILNVLYVPGVQANLLSAGQLKESGVQLQGDGDEMLLVAATGEGLGQARYNGRVLCTDLCPCSTRSQSTEVVALRTIVSETKSTPDRLHARLAHVGVDTIKCSTKHKVATRLDITPSTGADPPCVSCVGGKLARHTFPAKGSNTEEALGVVHIDLCGPFRVASKDGSLYFLLLKDRHTRFVWVMPVTKKSDVLREFQKWLVLVERQSRKSVLMLCSDRGGEFLGKEFTDFVDNKGIVHDLTCLYTSQQNGMAEREMRTVVESVRTMLLHMGVQHHWWHLALRQAVWVRKCLERSTTPPGTTPYQLLTEKKPDLTLARVWGCMVQFMGWKVLDLTDNKVVSSVEVIFYETLSLEVWKAKFGPASRRTRAHPPTDTSTATVPLLAEVDEHSDEDVVEVLPPPPVLAPPFPVADWPASTPVSATGAEGSLEALPVAPASGIAGGRQGAKLVNQGGKPVKQETASGVKSTGELTKSAESSKQLVDDLTVDEEGELSAGEESTDSDVVEVPITKPELRRTAAFTAEDDKVDDDLLYGDAKEDEELPELDPDMHADPEHRWDIATMTVKEALASWKGEAVKAAMEEEIRNLVGMGTWELVERLSGVNIMKNQWVLTTKYRLDDTVEREKAGLVVKGFTQVCVADYDERYSPVSSYVTLRIFLSIVTVLDLNLMQLDMKKAFLQSKLDRVLYITNSPATSSGLAPAQPARSPMLPAANAPASPPRGSMPILAATAPAPTAPALRAAAYEAVASGANTAPALPASLFASPALAGSPRNLRRARTTAATTMLLPLRRRVVVTLLLPEAGLESHRTEIRAGINALLCGFMFDSGVIPPFEQTVGEPLRVARRAYDRLLFSWSSQEDAAAFRKLFPLALKVPNSRPVMLKVYVDKFEAFTAAKAAGAPTLSIRNVPLEFDPDDIRASLLQATEEDGAHWLADLTDFHRASDPYEDTYFTHLAGLPVATPDDPNFERIPSEILLERNKPAMLLNLSCHVCSLRPRRPVNPAKPANPADPAVPNDPDTLSTAPTADPTALPHVAPANPATAPPPVPPADPAAPPSASWLDRIYISQSFHPRISAAPYSLVLGNISDHPMAPSCSISFDNPAMAPRPWHLSTSLLKRPFISKGICPACQRSTGDPRLILGKGYTLVVLGGANVSARRPLAALVPASRPAFPPCCPNGRAPPSLLAMTSLRHSGGSGDGGGGSIGSGGGRTSSRCGAVRWGVSGCGQIGLRRRPRESLPPQQLREWYASRSGGGGSSGSRCATVQLGVSDDGLAQLHDIWRAEFGDAAELPCWLEVLRQGVDIFALDYDAILTAMYALTIGTSESALPGTAPAEALHTFTLDSGGPVLARSSTVLPCPAVPSSSLSGLHLPSFSTNLVSTAALQDAMVTTTTPGGQRVSICTCTRTSRHLATFTRQPGSSLYTLATEPPQVAVSSQVSASGQVAPPCSYRLLSHQTLLWHHRLGHPSLPRLRGMHFRLLVSGLPRSLPPLLPSPAPPCLPCVKGRQRAAPHSFSFPPMSAPLQTLHMDVWGPARVSGQGRECYFLLVVDDYTPYTTVFPLRSKGQVVDVLIPCIRAVRVHLRKRFRADLLVLRLHSDRGGEFSSDLLRDFCGEGILQSFPLPDSPQQNGIPERCIGLVMEFPV
ncbi:unnamed protein product, partial [Closterium sp. NIES-54]